MARAEDRVRRADGGNARPTASARRARRAFVFALIACTGLVPGAVGAAGTPRPLLPNLVVLAPLDVYVAEGPLGCDVYEQAEQGARRCLRYDSTVVNYGRGPLELRYMVDQAGRDQDLVQRAYLSDGSYRDRSAGRYELHAAHGHFHYAQFVMARLWRSDAAGRLLDEEPVRESRKNGYCLYDAENYWSEHKRSTERRYESGTLCRPFEGTPPVQVNGLSVGWGDTYESSLTDQFVEVSDLGPGHYVLELLVDPNDLLRETDESDNSAFVHVFLDGGAGEAALRGRGSR